eukprot:TRINITY_DN45124_c0_g1_i1.p1 TRINITY_DN45124_c0_g1~~TRINITY_DN45124_c0_g1_i1.p1  ORF type:complete len:407 (-),score=107.56 TRINITY_DN45124_c0_g1_i1:162-1382(-)
MGNAARKRLREELDAAEAESVSASDRVTRAEEKRAIDAERLATLCAELAAFGDENARSGLLVASDRVGTRVAEQKWYDAQANSAIAASLVHQEREDCLRTNEIPALRARVAGLEAALAEAQMHMDRAETDRQTIDSSVEKLTKEAEDLRAHHKAQKEELQRLESELEVLQKSSDEARQQLRLETERQLRLMERNAVNEGRQARWLKNEMRATEAGNEVLRFALAEKDTEKETLERDLQRAEQERVELDRQLVVARAEHDRLEDQARERRRTEKEAMRLQERRERARSGAEGLKAEIVEVRAACERAERKAVEAVKAATEMIRKAENLERSAEAARAAKVDEFRAVADRHNAWVDEVRRDNMEMEILVKKEEQFRTRLAASEGEKAALRAELCSALESREEAARGGQ